MTPRDLAHIRKLLVHGGEWAGRRIVAADWFAKSFAAAATIDAHYDTPDQWRPPIVVMRQAILPSQRTL